MKGIDASVQAEESKYVVNVKDGTDGAELEVRNCIRWMPPKGTKVAALIAVAHGIFEHGKCYDEMARMLASNGYAVHAIDHRGHGASSGKRGFVQSYEMMVEDFVLFTDMVREQYDSDLPFFVFGHSMGSMITFAALNKICSVAGVMISGFPADNGPGSTCLLGIRALFFISKLPMTPMLTNMLASMDPDGDACPLFVECVTSDEAVRASFDQDERRCTPIMKNRTADELNKLRHLAVDSIPAITSPIMFIHGEHDEIGYAAGAQKAVERIGTIPEQKSIKIYPNLRHEVINEVQPARDGVLNDILSFFDSRMKLGGPKGRHWAPYTGTKRTFVKQT